MAHIIGGIGTSHVPAIGNAIARGQQSAPHIKPFFDGFAPVHRWLDEARPDIAVVFYNDHGLNFFLDKMPTFAVGAADEYRNEDEGWGLTPLGPFPGDAAFSWHLIERLVADEFDVTTCQEVLVDHGFSIPMALLWPGARPLPVRTVPIAINTVQHPLPSPARCFRLGQAVGRAIAAHESDLRVLILGTGGLSHQLDGARAGFLNREFDLRCMRALVDEPEALTGYRIPELVELAGAQGVELLMWIAMRGALSGRLTKVQDLYHAPISNTAGGLLALACEAPAARHALRPTG